MNPGFQKVLEFKGYGNPKNSTWFIGIEEAGEYDKKSITETYSQLVSYSKNGDYSKNKEDFYNNPKNKGKRYTHIYDIIGKIMSGVTGTDLNVYLDNHLFTKQGDCFLTNYYPLGKRSTKIALPANYKKWFNLGTEKEYQELVHEHRRKYLYKYWQNNTPKRTIAFGKGNWGNIKKAFHLEESIFETIDDKMQYCAKHKFYLCPFALNHQMSGARIEKLVSIIKSNSK